MQKPYRDFICEALCKTKTGTPIYSSRVANQLAAAYGMDIHKADAAAAVTIKRIMDSGTIPELRCYQKGIYYRTAITPFGETTINKEQLIADKYLLPDIGYETGLAAMHRMGLTSQMPRERVLATNMAKDCARTDKKLGVVIRPPKVRVTAENKAYLQVLDILDMLEKAPVDESEPFALIAAYISRRGLRYEMLLALAGDYYNQNTVLRLARTASAGGAVH